MRNTSSLERGGALIRESVASGQKVKLFFEGKSRDCHFSSLIEETFWAYFAPSCLDKEIREDLQSTFLVHYYHRGKKYNTSYK